MPNDFASFFEAHQNIELICFNGQNAEKLFRRYVEPNMAIPHKVLPSTSPAYAGMVFVEKLARWREALGPFIAGKKSP
jgi:hypoxanthine-DNA glycosylase